MGLVACILWGRSSYLRTADRLAWGSGERADIVELWSAEGTIAISRQNDYEVGRRLSSEAMGIPVGWSYRTFPGSFGDPDMSHAVLGFAAERRVYVIAATARQAGGREETTAFAAPLWAVAVLAFTGPAAAVTSAWRHRRRTGPASDRCPSCGYDLRASPGRCPECGRVPS